jgi:rare lipoprotein A
MKRTLIAFAALLQQVVPMPVEARPVTATVYSDWYAGRPQYCGGAYRHWGISAAHPWLPCGTRVTVRHRGRVLVVPITDRCDCGSIDLSAGAAAALGVPLDGIATVQISY